LKLITRVGILVAVVGLGLLISALNYPDEAASVNGAQITTQPDVNSLFFLTPQHFSVIVDSLNGTALLVVAPSDPRLQPESPILNASVHSKDVVFFDVPARGFYYVYFEPASSTTGAGSEVSFDLNSQGVPSDLALTGAILLIAGMLLALVSRWNRMPKSEKPSSPKRN
jgi:hypothetical protein